MKYIFRKIFEIVILATVASLIGAALVWWVMTYYLPEYIEKIERYFGG